jgi:undecaprenyl-phosphate galactose phosphotransferase
MNVPFDPVLLMRPPELPWRRFVLLGGSRADAAYTALNQALAALLLVLFAPLMACIAWRIRQEDGTPVLFAHYRVGQGGRLFRCLKFRTMRLRSEALLADLLARDPQARAEWERDRKLRNDPRVSPIGHLLRRTSLDELPQLFNVLRGQMHLVGPRPVVPQEIARYGVHKCHYLSVKPGMTGLWQVSGRNNTSYAQRVQFDAHYVETRSPWADLGILVRTAKVLVTREGAC